MHWKKNQAKIKPGAGEVDQQVKALAAEPDGQRSANPQDICGKERTECANCPLTSPCTLWQAGAHTEF